MKRLSSALLSVIVLTIHGTAVAAVPWNVTPITPAANGQYTPAPQGSYAAEFRENVAQLPANTSAQVEVAATPTLGQDGTLANDQLIAQGLLFRRDSDPSVFYGTMFGSAFASPGTYFFQFSANTFNSPVNGTPCPTADECTLASPVYSYIVASPPPRYSLSMASAKRAINAYLRRRHKAKRITTVCVRLSPAEVGCEARYQSNGKGPRHKAHLIAYENSTGTHVKHASLST